jgi:hypothetical protein
VSLSWSMFSIMSAEMSPGLSNITSHICAFYDDNHLQLVRIDSGLTTNVFQLNAQRCTDSGMHQAKERELAPPWVCCKAYSHRSAPATAIANSSRQEVVCANCKRSCSDSMTTSRVAMVSCTLASLTYIAGFSFGSNEISHLHGSCFLI